MLYKSLAILQLLQVEKNMFTLKYHGIRSLSRQPLFAYVKFWTVTDLNVLITPNLDEKTHIFLELFKDAFTEFLVNSRGTPCLSVRSSYSQRFTSFLSISFLHVISHTDYHLCIKTVNILYKCKPSHLSRFVSQCIQQLADR